MKMYIILVCTQQQWALQVTPVGFLLIKTLLIKNNKEKRGKVQDIKRGLESPPGIAGISVAECKID